MIRFLMRRVLWRTTPGRVRAQAHRLVVKHGDAALFRAFDGAARAQASGNAPQARFWEAVAREAARQIRRNALLASILAPSPSPCREPGGGEPLGEPKPPSPGGAMEGPGGSGHLRLVHAAEGTGRPATPSARLASAAPGRARAAAIGRR